DSAGDLLQDGLRQLVPDLFGVDQEVRARLRPVDALADDVADGVLRPVPRRLEAPEDATGFEELRPRLLVKGESPARVTQVSGNVVLELPRVSLSDDGRRAVDRHRMRHAPTVANGTAGFEELGRLREHVEPHEFGDLVPDGLDALRVHPFGREVHGLLRDVDQLAPGKTYCVLRILEGVADELHRGFDP